MVAEDVLQHIAAGLVRPHGETLAAGVIVLGVLVILPLEVAADVGGGHAVPRRLDHVAVSRKAERIAIT